MSSSSSTPVWFITGASSGFGEAVAKEALARGHRVVASARSATSLAGLAAAGAAVMAVDVTAPDAELAAKLAEAAAVHGTITHVLNAAGYILEGAVEEASAAESAAMFNTNVQGAVNISKAAIPHLRRAAAAAAASSAADSSSSSPSRPTPVLANFGSLGSWFGSPACAHYCASKWAVSGLSEGLAAELAGLGIAATVVEPGYFRTGFLNTAASGSKERRVRTAGPLPDVYGPGTAVGAIRGALEGYDNGQPGDVVKGARVIVDVLTGTGVGSGRQIPPRIVLGTDALEGIRKKCEETLALLKEWEDVARSTDY
ncbi:hypothetical protein RB594_000484 [Gaeumannomyces avenae]